MSVNVWEYLYDYNWGVKYNCDITMTGDIIGSKNYQLARL